MVLWKNWRAITMSDTYSRIKLYFHCKKCSNLESMTTNEHIAVGWTEQGIQVVCDNCKSNIIDIDFEGFKHKLYSAPDSNIVITE